MLNKLSQVCSHSDDHGILVLGEGNFSFSVDLAEYTKNVSINATSFDSEKVVNADLFAVENVKTLESFINVFVKHQVDATCLEKSFSNKKFSVIIFNFPHTGGKSNIKKCRKLLEDFFRSSLTCLCNEGKLIISLCKGQGGTPVDASRGKYGNTWKIVSCAAKSGFILHDMVPFDNTELKNYRTAGYRGVIRQNFFTVDGLVHIFKKGVSLDATSMPDISEIIKWDLSAYSSKQKYACDKYFKKNINILFEYLEKTITNSIYEIFQDLCIKCMDLNKDLNVLETCIDQFDVCDDKMLLLKGEQFQPHCFHEYDHFKLSYFCLNRKLFSDISPDSAPFSHQVSFVVTKDKVGIDEDDFVESILVQIQQNLFQNYEVVIMNCECKAYNQSVCSCTHVKSSQCCRSYPKMFESDKLYNVDDVPNFLEQIPVSFWTNFEPEIVVSSQKENGEIVYQNETSSTYKLNELENRYFDDLSSEGANHFSFKNCRKILINGICIASFIQYDGKNGLKRFLLTFHTNEVFLTMGVPDLRYIWCNDEIFKSDMLKHLENGLHQQLIPPVVKKFQTLIKHPLCHRHDLCFWLDTEHDEQHLMESIRLMTLDYVHSVRLIKMLRHEETNCVSYCYRMIYGRLDGPLSHDDSVQLQNRLRLFLLDHGYVLR